MRKSLLGATFVLLACAATGVLAQDHDQGRGGPPPAKGGGAGHDARQGPGAGPEAGGPGRPGPGRPGPGGPGRLGPGGAGWSGGHARGYVDFDGRYGHNHYYPSRGFVYGTLPFGAVSVGFGSGNYFFHGGVWFRPYGGRYVVVQPPLGIFLPMLPSDYATVWVGGAPYYYADGVYYNPSPGQGYVVVARPPGADAMQPAPAPPEPIFYPRNNQSAAQTEADRRDCNAWATTQPQAMADAKVFQRAAEACMDGRGYTVR